MGIPGRTHEDGTRNDAEQTPSSDGPGEMSEQELDDISGGRAPVLPDVAKTPAPGGPVPMPYPNT